MYSAKRKCSEKKNKRHLRVKSVTLVIMRDVHRYREKTLIYYRAIDFPIEIRFSNKRLE